MDSEHPRIIAIRKVARHVTSDIGYMPSEHRKHQLPLILWFKNLGVEDDEERYRIMSKLIGRTISSFKELYAGECNTLLHAIHKHDYLVYLEDFVKREMTT